jgi:outer membrane protein OmpA-like peptidoglycan-associated protein/predicted negative regulator of RcsB-dependent stress response
MTKLLNLLILVLAMVITSNSFAQKKGKYSTKSSKAIEAFEEARIHNDYGRFKEALKELEKALSIDDEFIEAYILRGYLYFDTHKYDECIADFNKVVEVRPKLTIAYYNIAQAEMESERYEEAVLNLNKFLKDNELSVIIRKKAEHLLGVAEFAIEAMKHPVPFNPINLGDSVNTKESEYWPTISTDNQTLIITRQEFKRNSNMGPIFKEDFYITHKDKNGEWELAKNVGAPINTSGNEGALALSPDGQFVFFVACNRDDGVGDCDLYIAKRKGDLWNKPINLRRPVNSTTWDSSPTFSSDGKTLYFSRAVGGRSSKNMDIYRTVFNGKTWGAAEPVLELNTDKEELAPFIHPDGETMYFSSNGHQGMGGHDLFYSRIQPNGKWSTPKNMGYPINTGGDERGMIVNAEGELAYIASERVGGKGGMDIYGFELYEEARPNKVTFAKGVVFDQFSKERLGASIELINLETSEVAVKSRSDDDDGEFLVCLPANREYALNVSKEGYAFYSESFLLKGNTNDSYTLSVPLQPIKAGSKVVLKNVFFETAKFDLKLTSTAELDKLVDFLTTNSLLKIELGGHTDNVGNKESNLLLSENRAKAVFDYLVSKGINSARLSYKGYGDVQPISDNGTPEGRQQNRRTEFTILSIE